MARVEEAELHQLAAQLAEKLLARGWMVTTAESCTGGWVGQVLTSLPGSSAWYDCGFITYSDAAKIGMLGVPAATLDSHGAVSEETAGAMASGALLHSRAQAALAITGIAGPGGATPTKPVGLVCYGWALSDGTALTSTCRLSGDREEIRSRSVAAVLRGLIDLIA
jgi:nicotinamide-nucleotide amidase